VIHLVVSLASTSSVVLHHYTAGSVAEFRHQNAVIREVAQKVLKVVSCVGSLAHATPTCMVYGSGIYYVLPSN
jgi:hypothetical protein